MASPRRDIEDERLDRAAIALLLRILEAPRAVLSPMAFNDFHGPAGQKLMDWGLLRAEGHQTAVASRNDPDLLIPLTWSPNDRAFGYFDPVDGWVLADSGALLEYAVSIPAVVKRLLFGIDMRPAEPNPVLDDLLWDAGDVRLPGVKKRVPVWFARRVGPKDVWDRVRQEVVARPAATTRIVLTSTSRSRLPDGVPTGTVLISLPDLVRSSLSLNGASLKSGMFQPPVSRGRQEPLVVSGAGAMVRLYGDEFRIGGTKQRAIIEYLYRRYLAGELEVSFETLALDLELGGAKPRLRDSFHDPRIMKELLFHKMGNCGFRLHQEIGTKS